MIHSTQYPVTMTRAAALTIADSTLVSDGDPGRSILRVEPEPDPTRYAWTADRAVALPGASAQPPAASAALWGAGGQLYAAPGGASRQVYALTPALPGQGAWTPAYPLKHYLPGNGGASLVPNGDALHQLHSTLHWPKLGGPANGEINAIALAPNGDIYVGGQFTQIGGVTAYNVARWDGAQWHSLGAGLENGVNNVVNALAVDQRGTVYVGGWFTKAGQLDVGYLAGWNGSSWFLLGAPGVDPASALNGVNGPVHALLWLQDPNPNFIGALYIGGAFSQARGWDPTGTFHTGWLAPNIVAWYADCANPGGCYNAPGKPNGSVRSLALLPGSGPNQTILLGGTFTQVDTRFDGSVILPANHAATFTTNVYLWSALGAGVPDPVTTLAVDPLSGDCYAASREMGATGIHRWDGASWTLASGVSGQFSALAADGGGSIYAGRLVDGAVYVKPWDASDFQLLGTEAPGGYTYYWTGALAADADGHVYAAPVASGPGVLLSGLSRWARAGHYRRDPATGAWLQLAYQAPPTSSLWWTSVVGDGAGNLYALWGSYTSAKLYRYDAATNTWAQLAYPTLLFDYRALAWAQGSLYALGHSDSAWGEVWYLYRSTPGGPSWEQRAMPPLPAGAATGDGLVWQWDGADHLYMLSQGGARLDRYRISANAWEPLPAPALSFTTAGGPTLARLGQHLYLYAAPGSGLGTNLLRYGRVGLPDQRLTIRGTAFVAPLGAPVPFWTNLNPIGGDYAFRVQAGADNAYAAQTGAAWLPGLPAGASALTLAQADFVDAADGVYRLGAGSVLAAGYHRRLAEAHVYPALAACDRCGAGGDLVWGQTAFGEIAEAVASGAARVLVHPGRYPQPFHLVSGVEVLGYGAGVTIVEAPSGGSGALVRAEGVAGAVVARLTLSGSADWEGLRVEDGARGITLARSIVRDASTGVRLRGDSAVELVHNTIVKNVDGVTAEGATPVDLRNTILAYNAGIGLTYGAPSQLTNNYNGYWGNGAAMSPLGAGPGNLFADPRFADAAAHDYSLGEGSPLIDAGAPGDPTPPGTGGRADIGCLEYGGAAFYADQGYGPAALNDGLTWGVDAFGSIQAALDAAQDALAGLQGAIPSGGYRVGVGPGTWFERVSVPSHVQLLGSGAERSTIDAGHAGSAVTLDGVVESGVSGFTLQGADAGGAGVSVAHASNQVRISRNVIRQNASQGVRWSGRSSGSVAFNTIVDNGGAGVLVEGPACWAEARNNILSGNLWGLRAVSGGLLRNAYNLLDNATDLDGAVAGEGTVIGDPALAGSGYYTLSTASPAVDAADPRAAAPAGGGVRADLGYRELLASPLALVLGPQVHSTVTANSGVARVEVGWRLVADATQPVTATLPLAWTTLNAPVAGEPLHFWSAPLTPGAAGLYRVYTRAADAAGNAETDEADWYAGAVAADATPPAMGWVTPPPATTGAPAVWVVAEASDYVDDGSGPRFAVAEVSFQITGPSGAASYPAAWVDDGWDEASGAPRRFAAWVPLDRAGSHSLFAVAADEAGHRAASAARAIWASGSGPVAAITRPASPASAPAREITVEGYARFDALDGVGEVAVSVDGGAATPAVLAAPRAGLSAWSAAIVLPDLEGLHTVAAVPSRGGVSGGASAITVRLDREAPALAVSQPAAGAYVTETVTFAGTAADSGSGLARVEVSVDGGAVWRAASLAGGAWSLSWPLAGWQDFVSYPARVRAVDRAGHATAVACPITLDSLPPDGLAPVAFSAPVGQHLDRGAVLEIAWPTPVDASGVVETLLAVDRQPENAPSAPVAGNARSVTLDAAGDWYAHLAARDGAGNETLAHYGPWRVRDMANPTFAARRQSIVLDGLIDTAHDEWRPGDLVGLDARSGQPQALYVTWDGQAIYLGWSGAWWTLDGTLWAYLDVADGGVTLDVPEQRALPFAADLAVQIEGPELGTLWRYTGGAWQTDALDFAHGPAGDAEARVPWSVAADRAVRLVAFALPRGSAAPRSAGIKLAAAGSPSEPWAAFPNTNVLTNTLDSNYTWFGVGSVTDPGAGQPQARAAAWSVSSPQPLGAALCAGSDLTYRIAVENREPSALAGLALTLAASAGLGYQSQAGATCASCAPGASAWTLSLPPVAAGATHVVTVTGRLAADLTGLQAVTSTLALSLDSGPLTGAPLVAQVAHPVDGQPPTVAIDAAAAPAIPATVQTFTGTATDGGGSGVALVRVRPAGGSWQAATGTLDWSAQLAVPSANGAAFTLEAQAVDRCGRASAIVAQSYLVDTTRPAITLNVPPVITVAYPILDGASADPFPTGGLIPKVEWQADDEAAPWELALGPYAPLDGAQGYAVAWRIAPQDGVQRRLRSRATDAVGNVSTTPWQLTVVDNVAPAIQVTQQISPVVVSDYLPGGTGAPVLGGWVTDGSGVALLRVALTDPLGGVYTQTAPLSGAAWQFAPRLASPQAGLYWLRVEAVDAHGNVAASGPYPLWVGDQAIAGLAIAQSGPTMLHSPVTLSASVAAGTNVTYTWSLGDGTTATGPTVHHLYPAAGSYTAVVTAANGAGRATASAAVVILPPTGVLEVDAYWPTLCAGWNYRLEIAYTNISAIALSDVTLVITAPTYGLVLWDDSSAGLAPGPNPGTVGWSLGDVAAGQTAARTLGLHVYANAPHGTWLEVAAAASAAGGGVARALERFEVRNDGYCAGSTPTPGVSATPTVTGSATPGVSATPTGTPTVTGSATPAVSATASPTMTRTPKPSATPTASATPTVTSAPAQRVQLPLVMR